MTVCKCRALGLPNHIAAWTARSQPIIARLLHNGHRIDIRAVTATVSLIQLIHDPVDHAKADLPAHRGRSHHLKGCPLHPASCLPTTLAHDTAVPVASGGG